MIASDMTTEQLFNHHMHGLWQALQDFGKEQNVTLTPKDSGVTLSMKKDGLDVEIGRVTVSGDNWFHFHYETLNQQPACFGYTSPRTGIKQCMRTIRRHTDELSQPDSVDPRLITAVLRTYEA